MGPNGRTELLCGGLSSVSRANAAVGTLSRRPHPVVQYASGGAGERRLAACLDGPERSCGCVREAEKPQLLLCRCRLRRVAASDRAIGRRVGRSCASGRAFRGSAVADGATGAAGRVPCALLRFGRHPHKAWRQAIHYSLNAKIDLSNLATQNLINKKSQTTIFTFDL